MKHLLRAKPPKASLPFSQFTISERHQLCHCVCLAPFPPSPEEKRRGTADCKSAPAPASLLGRAAAPVASRSSVALRGNLPRARSPAPRRRGPGRGGGRGQRGLRGAATQKPPAGGSPGAQPAPTQRSREAGKLRRPRPLPCPQPATPRLRGPRSARPPGIGLEGSGCAV
ncbi:FXYD domain-containing ion transport regulator 6 isoform X5 [Heterocephalus glaber]|uniref:FXYD domain-containing ion transport regulator 6 isoform X5 n=1 Tax=Heterocephalus glaber TaxID=10181 RepID=A0AAX6RAL9_HETGA|nr:FXYD domain-containing ion transport regulator 6 isoform X5 [Heterocephalus glaber]